MDNKVSGLRPVTLLDLSSAINEQPGAAQTASSNAVHVLTSKGKHDRPQEVYVQTDGADRTYHVQPPHQLHQA